MAAEPFVARIDLFRLMRLLYRRKWILVGVTACMVAAAGLVASRLTPEYRATATLLVEARKARVTGPAELLSGLFSEPSSIQTEIEILRSTTNLGRVVDTLRLDKDPEFGAVPAGFVASLTSDLRAIFAGWRQDVKSRAEEKADDSARARAILILGRNLSITVSGRSNAIIVSADSADPTKAKQIVDTIADVYVNDQLKTKIDANTGATDLIASRIEELKKKVEDTERAAAAFRDKAGLTMNRDATITSQSLSELNSQLGQARVQRAEREARVAALKRAQQDPSALGGMTEVLSNPLIASLRTQESDIARRVGDMAERYGGDHPRLRQTRAEQAQVQGRIATEVGKILASVTNDLEAAKVKEADLQAQVSQLERQAGGLGQSEVAAKQLEREAQSNRLIYDDYLKRWKELREQQEIQQLPDTRVISPATLPTSPYFPRYGLILTLAFGSGLILSAAVIGTLERLDRGLRTGEQVEHFTGQAMAGMVPYLSRSTLGRLTPAQYAVANPTSAYAASLRSIHTSVTLQLRDAPTRILAVTSALPKEGKSTFAASVASLLASANPEKKILLIDCDLKSPSVEAALGTRRADGTIDEFLSVAEPTEAVVTRDPTSGLYFVPARPNTSNPAEILDSRAMRQLMAAFGAAYDLVILDAPPVMADADARLVGRLSDYIVFIAQWEQTPRELVAPAIKLLFELDKPLSVVLTQVDVDRHAQYGFGDTAYYYSKYQRSYRSHQSAKATTLDPRG